MGQVLFTPLYLWLCRNMKKRHFEIGERWSGGKDLEWYPLAVRIQVSQIYQDIGFYTRDDFPPSKRPAS
jgi:hypothetical protein